ncbi:MAG: sulfatase-like hydrolase/transferase [Chloroflexia bacterium]|nr:sulfatase-like hydrolase/transferase [Chloroflexia bacterium]
MPDRPNVLLMIADDHRFDALSSAGNPVVQTPVLDRLAASGVAFRRAHMMGGMVGAVCVPSRASLMTGANVLRASSSSAVDDLPSAQCLNPSLATLPETFRGAGYHTHAIGKWHNDRASFAKGFCGGAELFFQGMGDHWHLPVQDFDPTGEYPESARRGASTFSTELFSDAATRFLHDYQDDAPFFLYVAFTAPHDPRVAPPDYAAMYDPASLPLPPNFLPEHPFDNGELAVRDEKLAPWPRTPEVIRQHIADYYAMISHLDAHIGRVLAALQQSGHADDTIVVYTADHGLAVGQHGLMGKQNLYEHSVRIPLIISGPGVPAGRENSALTWLADLYPTLCELTGLAVPPSVEAESLMPLTNGERDQVRDRVFALYKDTQRMVSDGTWKLIRYYRSRDGQAGTAHHQLFNLADDPWETNDLGTTPAQHDRVEQMTKELADWQRHIGDPLAGQTPRA